MIGFGNFLFRYRNRVFPSVLFFCFVAFPPKLFGGSLSHDVLLDACGIAIAIAGQTFRFLVIGLAYIKRGGLNKRVHADALVTDGLFAHARNPLYVGNLLILAGLFFVLNNPAAYLVGGLFFGVGYAAIVQAEEAYLTARFADRYRQYCSRVPRWLPRLKGMDRTVKSMEFNWRRVVSKEFSSCIFWALCVLVLMTYEAATVSPSAGIERLRILLWPAAALISAFLTIGIAKKQGRFSDLSP